MTNPVGGTVTKLLVEPGQQVEAGQALAVITSGELAELRVTALENSAERQGNVQQAEADLQLARQTYEQQQQIALRAIEAARTDVRVAQEQYDRDSELAAEGAIARRELLASEAGLADAKQALAEAESQLRFSVLAREWRRPRPPSTLLAPALSSAHRPTKLGCSSSGPRLTPTAPSPSKRRSLAPLPIATSPWGNQPRTQAQC